MKHTYTFRRTLSALVLLFLAAALARAYDFEAGGIYYNLSGDDISGNHLAGVTNGDNKYSGDIVIPSEVTYDGKTYIVTSIGERAFSGCTSLISIDLPAGLTSMGDMAFYGCTSLISIALPAGLTSIGGSAFSYCRSLTSIDLPAGLTSIGTSAFSGCSSLTSIDFPAGLTSIGGHAFSGCTSLTSIDLPAGLTSIGTEAFRDCTSLTSIDLPAGLTSIGTEAFNGCSSLTSIDFPAGLTSIGIYAFYKCTSLTSIDFPAGLTSIGYAAFEGCSSLTSVICRSEDVPELGDAAFPEEYVKNETTLYVPASAIERYKQAEGWKEFKTILPIKGGTGIDSPAAWSEDDNANDGKGRVTPYFTLDGKPVGTPVRGGIYVRGGRKIMVK